MHYWNEERGVFEGATRSQDYVPASGDQYVCYKVLGIMPIDAVYDSGLEDYLASGGQAIIDERLAAYEKYFE